MGGVHKAVIPAAGLGTRFLPASKAVPKEMLPIVDKPTLQYIVEEVVASGLRQVIFVTSRGKSAIEDHFDVNAELEAALKEKGKSELLEQMRELSSMIQVSSVRQKTPLGLGHAVLQAAPLVGDEPVAVLLGDDVIVNENPCLKQLIEQFERVAGSVVAVMEVRRQDTSKYGMVEIGPEEDVAGLYRVKDLVEKPSAETAPSNLAIMGRYVLSPGIFSSLRETKPGALGELQLTDGIRRLLCQEPVYAYRFEGRRYDAGNKLDYLTASIEIGMQHPEIGEELKRFLRTLKL